MNTLVLVMGLVGLSYLSGLFGRGSARAVGLPSGSEWIVVGFLLGPSLLGVVDRGVQADIEPVLWVTIGWVALVIGLDYGVVRSRLVGARRMILGGALGMFTVGTIVAVAWWVIPTLEPGFQPFERWALALGLGAVASETTSNAVRWISERHGAGGPLAELLDDLSEAKDIAPILVAGVGLCLHPRFDVGHGGWFSGVSQYAWVIIAGIPAAVVATGALLGLVAAVMLSREDRADQSWGIVVGITLLAVGTSARLRLPVIAPMFALGLALAVASRHRDRLLAMIEPTKRGALFPSLLLAGARIDPHLFVRHGFIVLAVLLTRGAVLYVSGLVITPRGAPQASARLVGWAMLPAGELTMTIGLSFALTFPDSIGETVLLAAAVVTIFGEMAGPPALRAALRRAGELEIVEGPEPAPAAEPTP